MNISKKVAIVIPYYRKKLTREEKISVNHLNKYLSAYDKFVVLPESIQKIPIKSTRLKFIHFPSDNFKSLATYSSLLTREEFYRKFEDYKYILIYQLDALVFSDQLPDWCKSNYDYIGAPFFNPLIGKLTHKKGAPFSGGNGGLSLRKVSSFLKVILTAADMAQRQSTNSIIRKSWFLNALLKNNSHQIWLNAKAEDYPFNEDGFWSFEAVKYNTDFKVAPFKDALKFAFERFPKKCFKLNNGRLPFGCHGWAKYSKNFWQPFVIN